MPQPLLIVGASARAAAGSALRAGFQPAAVDLFADADLAAVAPVEAVRPYPAGLVEAARRAPPGPLVYTGALENHPALVERLAAERPLWGNPPAVLRAARSMDRLRAVASRAGLQLPETRETAAGLPTDGSWLAKPIRSAGGGGVRPWRGEAAEHRAGRRLFQRRLLGSAVGVVYLGASGEARLVGASLIRVAGGAAQDPATTDFRYAGSLGPLTLPTDAARQLTRLGTTLARELGLVGLFGVDVILAPRWDASRAEVRLLEVNPRYTASVELLERAYDVPLLAWHAAAVTAGQLSDERLTTGPRGWGKAIVRAPAAVQVSRDTAAAWLDAALAGPWPDMADIPRAGTALAARDPVLTVFATGDGPDAVEAALQARAERVVGMLTTGCGAKRSARP